jgi:hypothetical protein
MAMGDQHYAAVQTQHVVILFERPARPFKQIGLVSSLGGWFASDGANYHKMQMAAAQFGTDAVIVPGVSTTISTGLLAVSKDQWDCDQIYGLNVESVPAGLLEISPNHTTVPRPWLLIQRTVPHPAPSSFRYLRFERINNAAQLQHF